MAEQDNPFLAPRFMPSETEPEVSTETAPSNPFLAPRFMPEGEDTFLSRTADRVSSAVDTASDIGEGIISGAFSFAEGVTQLPAIGFDAAFDTNTSRAVSDFFKPIQAGVQPEGTAGRVAADLTAFGATFIPFAGWLSRASRAAQLAKVGGAAPKIAKQGALSSFMRSADDFGRSSAGQKLLSSRAGLIGTTALATGAFGVLTSPDGRATLSDSFEALPSALRTEADTGLQGREESGRLIRNRLRQGVEDSILSGAFDVGLSALGAGARGVASVPQVAAAANSFNKGLASAGETIAQRFPKTFTVAREYLTPTGGADRVIFEEAQTGKNIIQNSLREATAASADYTSAFEDILTASGATRKNRHAVRQLESDVNQYLGGLSTTLPSVTDPALQSKMISALDKMKDITSSHLDRLLTPIEAIAKDPNLDNSVRQQAALAAKDILEETQKSQATYLRRSFGRYNDPVRFYQNLDLSSPLAKAAQKEAAQNIAATEGLNPLDAAVQEKAKAVVFDALGLGRNISTKNVSEKQLIAEALKNAKEANVGKGRIGAFFTKERPEFVTDGSLFITREAALDNSPKLRELLGEVTDPVQRFIRTIEDVSRATVAEDFYSALSKINVERKLMDAVTEFNAGGRPAVVTVPDLSPSGMYDEAMVPFQREADRINKERALKNRVMGPAVAGGQESFTKLSAQDVAQDYINRLKGEGKYVQLGEAANNDIFGGIYGSASGKLVSPETYAAITQPLRLPHGILSEVLGSFSFLRNVTQKMMIVPNIGAQVRSFLGNTGMLAGNANMPSGGDFTDLLYTMVATTKGLDDAGLTRLARVISLTGVGESNVVLQQLKSYRKAADDLTFNGWLNRAFDKAETATGFMRAFEAVYSNMDTLFKGAALLSEQRKILDAIATVPGLTQFDPLLLDAFRRNGLLVRPVSQMTNDLDPVEFMAAEVVRDTMPIYNLVVKAARIVDAVPVVGTFTSFAAENIRNSVGTVMRGTREAAFEAGPELRKAYGDAKMDQFEKQMRGEGIKRLMGYSAMAYIIPKTLVKMSMQATGTTPEHMEALYAANPDFLDGHDLVIIENNKEKKYTDFVDLSYVMPYAFMTDPVQAAIREYQQKGRADASTVEAVAKGAIRGFEMYLEPFASESLFFERLLDVLPEDKFGRGGKSATGAPIYGPNQNTPDKALAIFNHLMFSFVPNVATMLVEERNGELREGRLLRAFSGTPDRQGETTNPGKEVARLVTGFTPMRLDMRTDAQFMGAEYLPLRTDSITRALRGLKDAAATPESVVADWEAYLDELYRAQSQLYDKVKAMRVLGMEDNEIRYALINQAGIGQGEANGIISGRFTPGVPSKQVAGDIQNQLTREGRTRLLERIPFGTLEKMSSVRINEPLRTAPEQRPSVLGPQTAPAPRPAPAPPPGFSPVAPTIRATATARLQSRCTRTYGQPVHAGPCPLSPQRQGAVNPALLGDNPADQAANMAVAQNLGQA
jgi:hypothetical protein